MVEFAQNHQNHGQRSGCPEDPPRRRVQRAEPVPSYRQARGGKTRSGGGGVGWDCSGSESPRAPRTCVVGPRNAGVVSALSENGWGWGGEALGVSQERRQREAKDLLVSPARSRPPAGPIAIQGLLSPASTPSEYGRRRGGVHSPALSSACRNAGR